MDERSDRPIYPDRRTEINNAVQYNIDGNIGNNFRLKYHAKFRYVWTSLQRIRRCNRSKFMDESTNVVQYHQMYYSEKKFPNEMTPTHNLWTQMNRYLSLCCRGLDYDFIQGRKYEFQVTATDKGTPAKTGSASVRIWMKNVNDRSPVFDPPEQRVMEFNLQENSFVVVWIWLR